MKEDKIAPNRRGTKATKVYRFHGMEVTVSVTKGDYPKIILYDVSSGDIYTKANFHPRILDFTIEKGEVAIDDFSVNSGMLDFLIVNRYVREPHRWEKSGIKLIPIVKLQE